MLNNRDAHIHNTAPCTSISSRLHLLLPSSPIVPDVGWLNYMELVHVKIVLFPMTDFFGSKSDANEEGEADDGDGNDDHTTMMTM